MVCVQAERILPAEVLDALPYRVVVLDPEGNIISSNMLWRQFAKDNGILDLSVVEDTNYLEVCRRSAITDPIAKAALTGIESVQKCKTNTFQLEYPCHSPTENRWFIMSTSAIPHREGYVVVSHVNITDRVLAEASLLESKKLIRLEQEAKEAAMAAERSKTQFLASMSHEMRTPLTSIIGFSNLLKRNGYSREQRLKFVDSIESSSQLLKSLIDDVLDLAKIDAGRTEVRKERFNLYRELESIVTAIRFIAKNKQISITQVFDRNIPQTIETDVYILRQILNNLLVNAVKFTPDHGGIDITSRMEGRHLLIDIKDSGAGILEEDKERIFELFEQGNLQRNIKQNGIGLGLPISKKLAKFLKGDVELVWSEANVGSIFRLKLPLDYDNTISETECEDRENATIHPIERPLAGMRILLAEDSPPIQELIKATLVPAGGYVEIVNNGAECIEKIKDNKFDLVLMDMQMPGIDGLQATRLLRDSNYRLPIIAISAWITDSDKKRCLDAGCTNFINKPFEISKLLSVVQLYKK